MIIDLRYNSFEDFFYKATNCKFKPYPYQKKLAEQKEIPDILNVPTGAGKTEAAVLATYLWRRLSNDPEILKNTPRRLIYCLPMRVLVEQTVKRIESWLRNLNMENNVKLITIMGGNIDKEYKHYPQQSMIIVGTQDMLLSRALNRGYASSPFQWPIEFGLLNNDCLWVMDEIQLMGNGLATSVQLESFRDIFGTYGPHKTMWMSATVNPKWLNTADFNINNCISNKITKDDDANEALAKRNNAKKKLASLNIKMSKDKYDKNDVKRIKDVHIDGSITIVIANTVKRAQSIFSTLSKDMKEDECMLVHSRFRKRERQRLNQQIEELTENPHNMIIVATQAIEAGIDISARTMITELAPWSSLIQRFGRCNRKGEDHDSVIYVIDTGSNDPPYNKEDMDVARDRLSGLESISPSSIKALDCEITHEAVIRRTDMMDLFDTASDLSGNYTDVTRYIRSLEEATDVSVSWRELASNKQPRNDKIKDDEICNVPIGDIKSKDACLKRVWTYNFREKKWEKTTPANIYPGQLVVIENTEGKYDKKLGWSTSSNDSVEDIKCMDSDSDPVTEEESHDDDQLSHMKRWITLNDHTVHVINETENIVNGLSYLQEMKETLLIVARYHDIGKTHHVFQETMTREAPEQISLDEVWAKRGNNEGERNKRHKRTGYRHEALSALAFLEMREWTRDLDVTTYLIASHHGKVRMSMRSVSRKNFDGKYILGIETCGEKVPVFFSHNNTKSKASKEKLLINDEQDKEVFVKPDIARVGSTDDGKKSWIRMTLGVLKQYGPFRLGLLEAIIRAADEKASSKERSQE